MGDGLSLGDGVAVGVAEGLALGEASCAHAALATEPTATAVRSASRNRVGRDKAFLLPTGTAAPLMLGPRGTALNTKATQLCYWSQYLSTIA